MIGRNRRPGAANHTAAMKTSLANPTKSSKSARAPRSTGATGATAASKAPKPLRPRGAARVIDEAPARGAADGANFVSHPDGWYWVAAGGGRQFGPFATLADARADRDCYGDETVDEVDVDAVHEAESELGIADWIDAETGEPAEGQSPPHLEDH